MLLDFAGWVVDDGAGFALVSVTGLIVADGLIESFFALMVVDVGGPMGPKSMRSSSVESEVSLAPQQVDDVVVEEGWCEGDAIAEEVE